MAECKISKVISILLEDLGKNNITFDNSIILTSITLYFKLYSRETGDEGTIGGGTKVFKSKLTFQIQHEVFR